MVVENWVGKVGGTVEICVERLDFIIPSAGLGVRVSRGVEAIPEGLLGCVSPLAQNN